MRGLATELGVSAATVLRLERAGHIEAEVRIGRLVRFDVEKCLRALVDQREDPGQARELMVPTF